ncbi:hypothetical protein AAGG74_04635 [Bacillus mexicanus]|uniref:hypothetical protein n=1 Tax=Bacillus mexicanus TaxID=2834415 RepID=UPI0021647CF7
MMTTTGDQPNITEKQFEEFKSHFPDDAKIQSATFQELLANTNGGNVDWTNLDEVDAIQPQRLNSSALDCGLLWGVVGLDCVFLALGVGEFRSIINRATIKAASAAIEPLEQLLKADIVRLAESTTAKETASLAVKLVLKIALSGGSLVSKILQSLKHTMSWWQWLLFGASAFFTIMAALATDGVALIAIAIAEMALIGVTVSDCINAKKVCGLK